MRICFIDLDGVLNAASTIREKISMDPNLIKKMNYIKRKTNCKFALISSWRVTWKRGGAVNTKKLLNHYGVKIDYLVPYYGYNRREKEIRDWLISNKVSNWLAIDDTDLKLPKKHFVKINGRTGITDKDVEQAVSKLNGCDYCLKRCFNKISLRNTWIKNHIKNFY